MTDTAADRLPLAVGLKVTLIVQLAPAVKVLPQLFVWAKSPLLEPVIPIPPMVSAAVPVLLSVTVCGALVERTATLPKFRLVGDNAAEATSPVPVRAAVWGLPEALSLTESVALRVPPAVGVKVTLIVQLPPAATDEPQLLVWEKSPLFVPVTEMLVMLSAVLPELDSVTP